MTAVRLAAFFWIFFLFLIQNGLNFILPAGTPPFLVIGVIFYALSEGPVFGGVLGAYAGLFLEMFSLGPLGFSAATLAGLGYLSGLSGSKIFRESFLTQLLVPAAGACIFIVLNHFFYRSALGQEALEGASLKDGFLWWQVFLTAILSPLVFAFLKTVSYFGRGRRLSGR